MTRNLTPSQRQSPRLSCIMAADDNGRMSRPTISIGRRLPPRRPRRDPRPRRRRRGIPAGPAHQRRRSASTPARRGWPASARPRAGCRRPSSSGRRPTTSSCSPARRASSRRRSSACRCSCCAPSASSAMRATRSRCSASPARRPQRCSAMRRRGAQRAARRGVGVSPRPMPPACGARCSSLPAGAATSMSPRRRRSRSTPGAGSRCESGVVTIEAATVDRFVPQMVNFELVGGVDFKKGCYPGQEVVARSQYRGTTKRRTFLFDCDVDAAPGQDVFVAGDRRPSRPARSPTPRRARSGRGGSALVEVRLAALGGEPSPRRAPTARALQPAPPALPACRSTSSRAT